MRINAAIQRTALLGFALAAVLATVHVAQTRLLHASRNRLGNVSIDPQGRGRHWRQDDERGRIEFLSGDEVAPGTSRPIDSSNGTSPAT